MGRSNFLEGMIEEKLLNLDTAFIAKVVSVKDETTCSVKPLDKRKAYGHEAKESSVITEVPILNHVRHYKLVKQNLTTADGIDPNPHPKENDIGHLKVEPLKAGDLVFCVCAQRDISSAVKGMSTVPPVGHHQLKDAIVVGLLGAWDND